MNSRTFQREFTAACAQADQGETVVVERAGRRYNFQAAKARALPELRTPLAEKLWALSATATARGLESWDAARIRREVAARRGGVEARENLR